MTKASKTTANRRANVKNLPKAKHELGGAEIRKVKGGAAVSRYDDTAKNLVDITDGTSNTMVVGEVKKK